MNDSKKAPTVRRARSSIVVLVAAGIGFAAIVQFACGDSESSSTQQSGTPDSGAGDAAPSTCGNGVKEGQEQCDEGPNNGKAPCGCQADCRFTLQGTACASDGNLCNGSERCDGQGQCMSQGAISCDDTDAGTIETCFPRKGCVHLSFPQATATALVGSDAGGTLYPDACPAGEVMIGIEGETGASFEKIGVVCGKVELSSDLTVTIAAGTKLPQRGTNTGAAVSRTCPANQMVVGFSGRASAVVDQLILRCAPLVMAGADAGGNITPELGAITTVPQAGGDGGVAVPDTDCENGGVAPGANIRASAAIDAFGLRCGAPTLD